MPSPLAPFVVRVHGRRGGVVGAGVLVSRQHVATCAHVVADALGVPPDLPDIPADPVQIDFPFLGRSETLETRVVVRKPRGPDWSGDIAILATSGDLPAGAEPAYLRGGVDLDGHPFDGYGFAAGHPDGVFAAGKIVSQTASGLLQVQDVDQIGVWVQGGFSGSPLWDDQLQAVIGIVVGAEKQPETRTAFAMPADRILEAAREARAVTVDVEESEVRGDVVLLYKRDAHPDEEVLELLRGRLGEEEYRVFLDREIPIGADWARAIETRITEADAAICLLSSKSVRSQMLEYEIQMAHEAAQEQEGRPKLLPVRVDDDLWVPDSMAAALEPIQQFSWRGPEDDEALVAQLAEALRAPPEPLPATPPVSRAVQFAPEDLEPVGGAVPLDSRFYVMRPEDAECGAAVGRGDGVVLIKGPRQMGKTSLLARALARARESGAAVILTDLQRLNASHLTSIETFFQVMALWIADELDMDVELEDIWRESRGPNHNFESFVRRRVFRQLEGRVVWALDESDRLFTQDFGSEVFGLFRSWHNRRELEPGGPWSRLTLAIAYATEAHLFISDLNQSPFNVGTRLTLQDFALRQIAHLNELYGSPLHDASEVERFRSLVGGHPYLCRRGLHEMATRHLGIDDLDECAALDDGPYGDHLRRMLASLCRDTALCGVVTRLLEGEGCPDEESFYRLRSAGLIVGDAPDQVRPRCHLYERYLRRHLL